MDHSPVSAATPRLKDRSLAVVRHRALLVVMVLVLGWIAFVMVLISREPPVGFDSPAAAAAAVQQAVSTGDASGLRSGFDAGLVTEDYAPGFVAAMRAGGVAPAQVRLQDGGGIWLVCLGGVGDASALRVAEGGGRWSLQPWPAVPGCASG